MCQIEQAERTCVLHFTMFYFTEAMEQYFMGFRLSHFHMKALCVHQLQRAATLIGCALLHSIHTIKNISLLRQKVISHPLQEDASRFKNRYQKMHREKKTSIYKS